MAGRSLTRTPARRRRLWGAIVQCLLCAWWLAGCEDAQHRADEQLARAEQRLASGDAAAAEIELRDALKSDPRSGRARLLLGRALVATSDWSGAETEYRRAAELGAPADATTLAASELQMAMGRPAAVVDRLRAHQAAQGSASADLLALAALAQRELGDLAAADALLGQALRQTPGHVGARLAQARVLATRGELAEARRVAQALSSERPGEAAAWLLLGDLAQEPAAAAAAYRQALALQPRLVPAHAGLIRVSLRTGDRTAFAQQVAALRKAQPGDPTTLYHEALLAEQQGDLHRARERLQPLLRAGSNDAELMFLAGVVERRLGGFGQAETALTRAAQARPLAAEPRLELAQLHVQMARPERALAALAPLLAGGSTNAEAWTIAAQAHTLAGAYPAADAAFARAASLRPEDPRLRAAVGRSLLLRGQVDKGLAALKAAAAADADSAGADLVLVNHHMQRKEVAQALAATDALAAKPRFRPLAAHVRGRILQAGGDTDGARAAFRLAVAAEPRFLAAVSSLAQLDADQGRPDAARRHYEAYLELEPRSAAALLAVAVLSHREGAGREQAGRWIDRAVAADPQDVATWRSAIAFHRDDQDPKGALARARSAVAALPEDAELQAELAAAQLAAGDPQQALVTWTRAAQMKPASPEMQLRLAEAHLRAGNTARGAELVQRVLSLAPDWPPALQVFTALQVSRGQHDQALAQLRALQKRQPASALPWQLEAEVHAAGRAWPLARAALHKALEREPESTALAVQMHTLLLAGSDPSAAAQWAASWQKQRPNDAGFLLHLAQLAERSGDDTTAVRHYRRALGLRGSDAAVMNNLALALTRLKDPAALPLAQQAVRLAPYSPQVLDTLAQALSLAGEHDKAIASQLKALELLPQDASYRWRLAQVYLRAGQPERARAELQQIQALGLPLPEKDQVEPLLKQLSR